MARIADPTCFRAEAVAIDWAAVAKSRGARLEEADPRVAERSPRSLRLTWACHSDLGVPHGVFTVWRRRVPNTDAKPVAATPMSAGDGALLLDWGTPAGRVVIDCGVADASKPVIVKLCWRSATKEAVTATQAATAAGGAAHIDLRTPGATCAIVGNAVNPVVRIVSLEEIVDAADWEPIEYVGLPVPAAGIAGTDYDGYQQGPPASIVPAPDAAVERLLRGGPPVGWSVTLPSGATAPRWQAPDPDRYVRALGEKLLPALAGLYTPGLPENLQSTVRAPVAVAGPGDGAAPSTMDVMPWPLLSVPAVGDPFANLALGFGTAYPLDSARFGKAIVPVPEFLVTAGYSVGAVHRAQGPGWNVEVQLAGGEYAAYAPPVAHLQTPQPLPLDASRYSLLPPGGIDAPWRENVRMSWDPLSADAGTVRPTQVATVRAPVGGADAEALFGFDPEYDGWTVPNVPPVVPGDTLHRVVAPAVDIPLGSGGRHDVYAAALSDVYGIWSPWTEDVYDGGEPAALPPGLANLAIAARYAGSPQCPSTLDVDVIVEWRERTTASVELSAVLYPMATPTSHPPAGIGPESAPPGAVRHSVSLAFTGDVPTGVGCTVVPLDADGRVLPAAGPAQGEVRRFRVHVDLSLLDFSATDRWGVEVWARRALLVGPSPSAWAPDDPARAMLASVGSPVPVIPVTAPLPGVPLASLPDADGRSHVRIVWGAAGSNVKTFVVWQAGEQYLRERCGEPEPDRDTVPGARLARVRELLVSHPEQCRLAFRRVAEVGGDRREADVALARGATGIQFFVVTSTTKTGADAPWPYNTADADVTQVFIAPHVVRPGQPLARAVITSAGVEIDLEVPSAVPVSRFRVYSTHRFDAARRADSMGAPEFAAVTAPADPLAVGDVDPVSGHPLYRAAWAGALEPSWRTWYLRTIAEPDTSGIPERGWRGLPSAESDIVTVRVPPDGPPDLEPLLVESAGPDHTVLVARTSTTAPIGDTDFGPHLLGALTGATMTEEGAAAAMLAPLSELAASDPPPPPAGAVVVTRGERVAGRTPLAVWFTRTDAATPIELGVRLVDPLGRAAVQLAQVPGWTAPIQPDLQLVAVTAVSATATVITVSSTESRLATPPFVLSVAATRRVGERYAMKLNQSIALPDIPRAGGVRPPRPTPFPIPLPPAPLPPPIPPTPAGGVQFAFRAGTNGAVLYDIHLPLALPFAGAVTLTSPDGSHTSVRAGS